MKKNSKFKKYVAVLVAGAMFLTSFNMLFAEKESKAATQMTAEESTSAYGLSNPAMSDGVTTWDCIYFGNYWQEDTNGDGTADQNDEKQPIKWRVLSVDGDDAFLLADQSIDCQLYNEEFESVTWETCTLRTWLNSTFMNNAFSTEEQEAIKTTKVVTKDNLYYGTKGGNDTTDAVYLLSMDEMNKSVYGFDSDEARKANNTSYVKKIKMNSTSMNSENKTSKFWWLRSPGITGFYFSIVGEVGVVDYRLCSQVDSDYIDVRPALHINLSQNIWKTAGKVSSKDDEPSVTVKPTNKPTITPTVMPTPTITPTSTIAPTPIVTPSVSFEPITKNPGNPVYGNGATTWDCIYFGNYWQNDTNGDGKADQNDEKQPIKWRVLSVDGDDAFLLADEALDCKPYNETDEEVTWETCTLRQWLNSTFLDAAFAAEEQSVIRTTTVVNENNTVFRTLGGNSTSDKIFLLSQNEVKNLAYGFNSDYEIESKIRQCKASAYTVENKCWIRSSATYTDNCWWWLRSPGYSSSRAIFITFYGCGYDYGTDVNYVNYGVRPALHVNLSSSSWKYAGTVSANNNDSTSTMEPSVSPAPTKAPQVTQMPSVTPAVSPSVTPTITPQPATTPANTGNQASKLPQQQPTPQAGTNTGTTADTNAKVSLIKQSKLLWKTAKNTKGRKLTASWKKASEADGYQIQYAPNKKFKKAKSKTVKSTSVTLKKLKKKTTYFVRVRAYKAVDGKKVYGKWSSVKKVKVKK